MREILPQKTVIIIAGPTAVGKTSAGIELAKHFNTEIISADSRQCYKELNIGVARPSSEDLITVPHHFIASHSIHHEVTAATFEKIAIEKTEFLFREKDVVLMVGGTGLYIKAFTEGLDFIPAIPPDLRERISKEYEEKGMLWLQDEISRTDPGYYASGEIKNPRRLLRALEVLRATGQSILSFRKNETAKRNFRILKIGLNIPKDDLVRNISNRVDQMMHQGLVDEVRSLVPFHHLQALQTVGYREIFTHLIGETTKQEAVERIKINTRQYAKRQLTWFRKDKDYHWMEPDPVKLIQYFSKQLDY